MPPIGLPLADSKFAINIAGLAGFFGGKQAITAMATIHFYTGRRWLGWYNAPGGSAIAEQVCKMTNFRFWDAVFPGPGESLPAIFGLDSKTAPDFIGAFNSEVHVPTGHLAHLAIERSKESGGLEIVGRMTNPIHVTYLAMKQVNYNAPIQRLTLKRALWGLIPIVVSVTTCLMCALVHDWYSFAAILVGIICSGCATFVIGSGTLTIVSSRQSHGGPPGHGVLIGERDIMVIKGAQQDTNIFTKGRFDIEIPGRNICTERHPVISFCLLLLVFQFILQLLVIPLGSLFGQLMFIVSLGVSWIYNACLCMLEKEKLQTDLLFTAIGKPPICRFNVGTRTTTVVFVCLLLFHGVEDSRELGEHKYASCQKILDSYVPSSTVLWKLWKSKVIKQLFEVDHKGRSLDHLRLEDSERVQHQLPEYEIQLLNRLLDDAVQAFKGYFDVCETLPVDSSQYIA